MATGKHEPLDLPAGKTYTHEAHRFPGKFHPPIVKQLLRDHPEHDVIADPMCGSGTVAVEGVVNNKRVLCTDLDPLSCLISRAKSTPVDPDAFEEIRDQIINLAEPFPDDKQMPQEVAESQLDENLAGTPYVAPYNTFHWFEPYVVAGYSKLLAAADTALNGVSASLRDAVHMSLAAMVRSISRADPHPVSGLEVTSVRKQELEEGVDFDVAGSFRRISDRVVRGYREFAELDSSGTAAVRQANAKRFSEVANKTEHQPSLIITSPPYCNAIEYTRRHRLESEWLGLWDGGSLAEIRNSRISTSREFFGSHTLRQSTLDEVSAVPHKEIEETIQTIETDKQQEKKANRLRKYFLDAYDWLSELYEALPSGGLLCMTVGPSTSYGVNIDTPRFLREIATDAVGFDTESKRRYTYKNNKMQYPTDGPSTEYEELMKLRKR